MPTITRLQWLVWIAVFLIIFFSLLPEGWFLRGRNFTLINVTFYATVIYGNISFLFPRFYEKGHKSSICNLCHYTFISTLRVIARAF